MYHADDIAFQRAILANPADTTLKLVYADWLQDRDDPRAEYVRRQLEIRPWTEATALSVGEAREQLGVLASRLDPGWVGFMESLAQPFEPIPLTDPSAGDPFVQPIGRRGWLTVFESQYQVADDWSEGLLADLVFLMGTTWSGSGVEGDGDLALSFLCELHTGAAPRTQDEVRAALLLSAPGTHSGVPSGFIEIKSAYDMFAPAVPRAAIPPEWERRLCAHWAGGSRYDVWGLLRDRPSRVATRPQSFSFIVGKSPHGNRLVGLFQRTW